MLPQTGRLAECPLSPSGGRESSVYYTIDDEPDLVGVPVGGFADPGFPPPKYSVYGERRHPWVVVPDDCVERQPALPLRPTWLPPNGG
jgi:hypothetical protein